MLQMTVYHSVTMYEDRITKCLFMTTRTSIYTLEALRGKIENLYSSTVKL